MKSVKDLKNLKGKKVIIRTDFNVPIKNGKIIDPSRIENSFNTIDFILKKGGLPIIITHHGELKSLDLVYKFLNKKYKTNFIKTNIFEEKILKDIENTQKGEIVLLDNIRNYPEEETNDMKFAKRIASLGDIYINDAFSVSHRKHASVVGIPKYLDSFFGISFIGEINRLDTLVSPKSPFLFILGGAKLSTKIPLLKKIIEKADNVIIAGVLLNTFYKELGFNIGESKYEDGFTKDILKLSKNPKLLLPIDVTVLRGEKKLNILPNEIESGDIIVDIGKQSIELINAKVLKSKTLLWNGPTGWYEKGFGGATKSIAKTIKESKTKTIIGGGDTGAMVRGVIGKDFDQKRLFVSTGGGATLDYLSTGTLPGIKVIK